MVCIYSYAMFCLEGKKMQLRQWIKGDLTVVVWGLSSSFIHFGRSNQHFHSYICILISFSHLPPNSKPWRTTWPTLLRGTVSWRTRWPNWFRSVSRLRKEKYYSVSENHLLLSILVSFAVNHEIRVSYRKPQSCYRFLSRRTWCKAELQILLIIS